MKPPDGIDVARHALGEALSHPATNDPARRKLTAEN